MARALAERGIPFVVKGLDVFETAVIRDLLACLAAVASLSDSEALFRVAALPMFGVDGDAMRSALAAASREASFASLLPKIPGGGRVLAAVEKARGYAASVNWEAAQVCAFVVRAFGFSESDDPVRILREFVEKWHTRPITESGSLEEFIDYVDLFREAGGTLELPVPAAEGAVQLMTAHSAKGLEFETVFVLRANSGSFPMGYREAVFEFPQALREMPLADDSKQIHAEEERRLFYVALTRARDSLRVYARPGKGKDTTPAGLLRGIMNSALAADCWRQRPARPFTATIEAGAAPASGVATLAADEAAARNRAARFERHLHRRLRHLPDEIQADAGLAHSRPSLRFDAVRQDRARRAARHSSGNPGGRPRSEGEVLQRFRELMAAAAFDDDYQRTLFEQQGARQLGAYLSALARQPAPPVLHAERSFQMKVDGVPVRGRMDRVDRLEGGGVRVIDFKTGSVFDQDKADKSLQLSIYAIAARETLNAEPAELVIHNLEDNSEVRTARDEEALLETRAKIAEVAEGIAAERFDPKAGFWCGWCEFRNLCPATEQKLYGIATAAGAS